MAANRLAFEDRVVIITGSSRGIGFTTARRFLDNGALVVLNGRNAERLQEAQRALDPDGSRTLAVQGDMTIDADADRLVAAASERWGRVDILVCNAGLMMRGRFADLSSEVVGSIINTNIVGVAIPIIKAIPVITKQKGSIEIISSLAGVRGMPHISLYCASKMALTAIAQALWVELAGTGVHVGILYVGITENDPDKRLLAADGSAIQVSGNPHSTQDDVAKTVLRQVRRRIRRIVMTPAGKALVTVQWLMPRVVTFLITKAQKISAGIAE
jgi:short-subunit dehydrogenase